jgi:uncharacterized protein YbjT (DUF2867 family)
MAILILAAFITSSLYRRIENHAGQSELRVLPQAIAMYLVAGATGSTGGAVARLLIDAGHPVRLIVREPARCLALKDRGAEIVVGDLADATALAAALDGASGGYLVNPAPYGSTDPMVASAAISRAMAEAIRRADAEPIVVLTARGVHNAVGGGVIEMAAENEALVRPSGGRTVFLRPCSFMENWSTVTALAREADILPSFYLPIDQPVDMVAVEDIAAAAVELMLGQTMPETNYVEIAGPAKYSPLDVASAFSRALGKDVRAVPVERAAQQETLEKNGISAAFAAMLVSMYEAINSGSLNFEDPDAVRHGAIGLDAVVNRLAQA